MALAKPVVDVFPRGFTITLSLQNRLFRGFLGSLLRHSIVTLCAKRRLASSAFNFRVRVILAR